ncbi:nucleotidyltransferase [Fructilactobacillus cliffordii]|uniref:tRNA(Met) cytidine acetate ligase n=1 Tax=Fructilactobacillus cliffordii TaxID=2940299 RepID=A0A9Q9E3B7_9LACO|nr:nucleotidyltransferase [Fructilactobacillus cliffordii]USS89734.1 nucleotidyltransferase [Fructilactobacillus cliffordii]
MKPTAVAIIAEYVPFHNGHLYQLQQAQQRTRAETTVAIMSGNWTQRGEPAIFDKWTRTKMALASGIDLVVELPAVATVQPAHLFAQNAVELVQALDCDYLAFGCEHADWDFNQFTQQQVQLSGAEFADRHLSFPEAFQQALQREEGIELTEPNDTLGFWYAQAIAGQADHLQLVPIKRQVSGHQDHELHATISSGTAIRKALLAHNQNYLTSVPESTAQLMATTQSVTWEQYWPYLKYAINSHSLAELRNIYQMTEGLEHRIKRIAVVARSFTEFLELIKTKRYTYPRLQRLCTDILLNYQAADVANYQPVLRILGMSTAGQRYLHAIKKRLTLPLITTATRSFLENEIQLEVRAGLITEMVTGVVQDRRRSVIRTEAIKE